MVGNKRDQDETVVIVLLITIEMIIVAVLFAAFVSCKHGGVNCPPTIENHAGNGSHDETTDAAIGTGTRGSESCHPR